MSYMLQQLEGEDWVQGLQLASVLGEPELLYATQQCLVISPPPAEVVVDAGQSSHIR